MTSIISIISVIRSIGISIGTIVTIHAYVPRIRLGNIVNETKPIMCWSPFKVF